MFLAIALSILVPLFITRLERSSHQPTCISQVRQIATAVQMYTQDNDGYYPADPWTKGIMMYLGGATKILFCSSDTNKEEGICSYGYNGNLLLPNKQGVKESQVMSPVDVGCLCDASPSRKLGQDSYIPGGGLLSEASNSAIPFARHSKGIVMGFCDGHARYVPADYVPNDLANQVTRGFLECVPLGLVDNPGGGLSASARLAMKYQKPRAGLTIGGEYCTKTLVTAMAALWNAELKTSSSAVSYHSSGFTGQYASGKGANYLWGVADGTGGTTIGHDCVIIIVSKNTTLEKNAVGGLDSLKSTSGWNLCTTACIDHWFTENGGSSADHWQAYTLGPSCATRKTFARYFTAPGQKAKVVANDYDMVDQIANDPYGIGYCSSACLDLDRVQALGLQDATGKQYFFPNRNLKERTCLPHPYPNGGPVADVDWPRALIRELKVQAGGEGARIVQEIVANGNKLAKAPYFACSYW